MVAVLRKVNNGCMILAKVARHNKWNGRKLHGNISRNGYGNAIIGRYCGYFEEGIRWVYGAGESCAAQERLAMVEG